jgi:hypothetical protein
MPLQKRNQSDQGLQNSKDAQNVLDQIKNGDINFIISTPSGKIPREPKWSFAMRRAGENSHHDDGARRCGAADAIAKTQSSGAQPTGIP